MIDQKRFIETLTDEGVGYFTGVPDSYLNGFCNYLIENLSADKYSIAANEGNAIGIASGYYFATKKIPLVYMQNSGMGNALNPIISLADKHVYRVPMVLLIGWRGEPGSGDWPQHVTQGEVTPEILKMLNIPYVIASKDDDALEGQVRDLLATAKEKSMPVAIIGRKGVFNGGSKANIVGSNYPLSREEVIEILLGSFPKGTIFCATTGRATRELYFLRERRGESHKFDFLNVGSMGHNSSVALGIAIAKKDRKVVCLDGDSAAIMHMGALSMVSKEKCPQFTHVVLNNGAHESVGGQASAGQMIDFTAIAKGAGYDTVDGPVSTKEEIIRALTKLGNSDKAKFLDIRIHIGLKGELPPLDICHKTLIEELMEELQV